MLASCDGKTMLLRCAATSTVMAVRSHPRSLVPMVLTSLPAEPITCAAPNFCGFNTYISAFGCCTGTSGASLVGCQYMTKCYDSTAFNQCGESCQSNTMNGWWYVLALLHPPLRIPSKWNRPANSAITAPTPPSLTAANTRPASSPASTASLSPARWIPCCRRPSAGTRRWTSLQPGGAKAVRMAI
jgi:hypothetical protein